MTQATRSSPALSGIQLLRAIAATAVIVAHVQYDFGHRQSLPFLLPSWLGGFGAGVHLFFVISGFIMVYSSERLFGRPGGSVEFLSRRIARIVPIYWTVTTLMLGYDLARGFAAADTSMSLVINSYLFIPFPRPSGEMGPLYGVGWTLNYEMFFYVIFSISLLATRTIAICGIIGILIMFSLIHAVSADLPLPFRFWFDPIILEFALGMGLGVIYQANIRVPDFAGVLLLLAAFAGFYWTLTPGHMALPSWIGLGIPSLLMLAAVSLTKTPFNFPLANKLGDASYAIYLVHPIVIAIARKVAARGYLEPSAFPWIYLIGIVTVSVGAALFVHEYFERPVTARFRNWLLSSPRRLATRRI
ncbi:MAG TPA: acyltransferase [Stellaceae bacterium]|nr:acyltransferase [Stellaceae bacterium]